MAQELTLEDITDNIVILKISRSYRDGMSETELYDVTRGCWKRRLASVQNADYALAVVNGIVKEVYQIDEWLPAEEESRETIPYSEEADAGRIIFRVRVADAKQRQKYQGRSVRRLFKWGDAGPVKVITNKTRSPHKEKTMNRETRPGSAAYENAISVRQMREADAYTIQNFTSGRELMRRAAQGVYDSVKWEGKKVAIVCGSGNNGGDGYALASILAGHGVIPRIFRTSEKFSDDGLYYHTLAVQKGVPSELFCEGQALTGFDIVVDCILGTGFRGVPGGPAAAAITAINASGACVVSVDINSGMNGDTGEAELAVRSDLTVSIGFYKKGMFLGRAPELIGELVNVDIGIVLPKQPPV